MIEFFDKKGNTVNSGDQLISDAGIEVDVLSIRYVGDFADEVMFVQQIKDPMAFSYLTRENLAFQFSKVN